MLVGLHLSFIKDQFHLFARLSYRKKKGETEREVFHALFHSPNDCHIWAKVRSQDLLVGHPHGCSDPSTSGWSQFPGHTSRELDSK